jgi:transcriptional regulator with XRE-family HTH domain
MDGKTLRDARLDRKWTQQQAAQALGVTQAYWSMLEKGRRTVPKPLIRKALKALRLSPTALPLPVESVGQVAGRKHDFSAELGALGYPGFAYLSGKVRFNPALLLSDALNEANLDSRVAEGLPWLALNYPDMDWNWLVRDAKLRNRQNRLGFAVSLAREVAEGKKDSDRAGKLRQCLETLECARLAREDTFCHEAMTQAERTWLREHRSPIAEHWNLLTDLKGERLAYASP